jgi:mannose-6-phosphate isomerase-like protein (cupin superfamily)
VWTVNGKTFEGAAGDTFVIKAGEIHSFMAIGESPLVQSTSTSVPSSSMRTCRTLQDEERICACAAADRN